MPAFASPSRRTVDDLIAFLTQAGIGSAGLCRALPRRWHDGAREPPYPGRHAAALTLQDRLRQRAYVITPPWSRSHRLRSEHRQIKWQTPYGDLPQAGPSDKLRGNVYPKSGFVITAGGLVAVRRQRFEALRAGQRHRGIDFHERPAEWLVGCAGGLRSEWPGIHSVCAGPEAIPFRRRTAPARRRESARGHEGLRCAGASAVMLERQ